MRTHDRFHLLVLSRSWSYDYWGDIHHEVSARSIRDHGPSSFMEHHVTSFDAIPTDEMIAAVIKDHDAMLARYDGHVERAATAVLDQAAWAALQDAYSWRNSIGTCDFVYHRTGDLEALKARYPGLSADAASAPAALTSCFSTL